MTHIPSYKVIINKCITATDEMMYWVVLENSPSHFYFKTARFLYKQNRSIHCGNINQTFEKHGQAQSNDYCLRIIYIYKKP